MEFSKLTTALAIIGLSWAGMAIAVDENGVRSSYDGSHELPDGIAFSNFLGMVDGTKGNADLLDLQIVATALGTAVSSSNRQQLQSRAKEFRSIYREMTNEQHAATIDVLCHKRGERKSDDQLFASLNDNDDLGENIAGKYYLTTLNQLSGQERDAFMNFINELKISSSHVKVDSRAYIEKEHLDVRTEAQKFCDHSTEEFYAIKEDEQ